MKQREPLSSVDRAWLRMESEDNPMMITAVMVLESPLDMRRFRRVLRERLLAFDRFRQRVVRRGDAAWWSEDPHFNLNNHVHIVGLPGQAGKRELEQLVGDLASTPLDFRHPLWQTHIVDHYHQGSVVIARLHHCIADGIALVQVLLSLTDESPEPEVHPVKARSRRRPSLNPSRRVLGSAQRLARVLLGEALTLARRPGHIRELADQAFHVSEALAYVGLMPRDPPGPLKGQLCGRKRVAWATPLDLAEVKRIAHALDGTVNDVLMTTATGALRNYLGAQNQAIERGIHVTVPFNLRPLDQPIRSLGNRFGFVIAHMPIDIPGVRARYEAVREHMRALKHSPQPMIFYGMLNAFGWGPDRLERTALNILSDKATLLMTNVPGPKKPLYIAGSRLIQPMVWAPQSGHIGLGLTIFSYAGEVQFGVVADTNLIPRPSELARQFTESFAELVREVDAGSTPTKSTARKRRPPSTPPPDSSIG
ncbi:WS/DGAT/MGAT family O-acyltransferase [Salinisphaera hydrothermalis]|uniref:WS/DGAT/MGAT family O-acyltransferase n=1 Tax=Salinisphaera hydrothermalis TaxID=563188 RepID=UPI00333EAC0A